MTGEKILKRARTEIAARLGLRGQQRVSGQLAKASVTLDPGARRHPEPMLAFCQDCSGQELAKSPLEDMPLLESTDLVARRQRAGELYQRRVQERESYLDAASPAWMTLRRSLSPIASLRSR